MRPARRKTLHIKINNCKFFKMMYLNTKKKGLEELCIIFSLNSQRLLSTTKLAIFTKYKTGLIFLSH